MDRFDLLKCFAEQDVFKNMPTKASSNFVFNVLNHPFFENLYIFRKFWGRPYECRMIIPLSDIEDEFQLNIYVDDFIKCTKGRSFKELVDLVTGENGIIEPSRYNYGVKF